MNNKNKQVNRGFVLVFTLFLVAMMLLIIVGIASSTISGLNFSSQHMRSVKASYAADAGLRCAVHLAEQFDAFDTTSPAQSHNCGINPPSSMMQLGYRLGGTVPETCVDDHYVIDHPLVLDNGSCTFLEVDIDRETFSGGFVECRVVVYSHGKSSCNAGSGVVERTRWQSM